MAASQYILRASGAPGWGNCSAWLAANAHKPRIDTPEILAGNATHWVGASCLELYRSDGNTDCGRWLGQTDPDGTVVDDTMIEGAQIYVEDCTAFAAQHGQALQMMVERKVHMPRIHQQNGGTFDCGIIVPSKKLIFVSDYKNGHVQVNPYNLQNINYVEGMRQFLPDVPDNEITVVLRTVQPFCYTAHGPVREWVGMLSDLRGEFNRLHYMGHQALTEPRATAGPTQCRNCYGRTQCETFKNSVYGHVDRMDEPFVLEKMDAAALGVEYGILENGLALVNARFSAVEEELKFRIREGESGSGKTLETALKNRDWTIPPAQTIAVGRQFGVDLSVEKVKTPTQAKAMVSKELRKGFELVLQSVAHRPISGLKLVDAADSKAARAFGKKEA